jgi:hypothetical protein
MQHARTDAAAAGLAAELQLRVCGHERHAGAAPRHGVEGDTRHRVHARLLCAALSHLTSASDRPELGQAANLGAAPRFTNAFAYQAARYLHFTASSVTGCSRQRECQSQAWSYRARCMQRSKRHLDAIGSRSFDAVPTTFVLGISKIRLEVLPWPEVEAGGRGATRPPT